MAWKKSSPKIFDQGFSFVGKPLEGLGISLREIKRL